MGAAKSKVNIEEIQNTVSTNAVVVYSKNNCGFCVKAKDLLQQERIEFKEQDLDELQKERPAEYSAIVNGLVYMTRITSVPQIFICGKFIGGYTDLEKLHKAKELLKLVQECSGERSQW